MLARMNSDLLFYTPKEQKTIGLNPYQEAFLEITGEIHQQVQLSKSLNAYLKTMKPLSPNSNKTPFNGSFASFKGLYGPAYDQCITVLDVIANQLVSEKQQSLEYDDLMNLNIEIQGILSLFIRMRNQRKKSSSCVIL